MYPRNKLVRRAMIMPITLLCFSLSACGGTSSSTEGELGAKKTAKKKSSVIILNTLKSFPTAEGAGAVASGGRKGKVVYVTNTNEIGEGSLHEAVTGYGDQHRTILFSIGGKFEISNWVWAENVGNFTLAGQTANDIGGVHIISIPWKGIGRKYEYSSASNPNGSLYINNSDNMIIRYISAKGGTDSGIEVNDRFVAFGTADSTNTIYDHYSSGWSSYLGKFDGINRNTNTHGNFTIQYSLGHEGIAGQNVGGISGSYASGGNGVGDDTWNNNFGNVDSHHNAYIGLTHRHTNNVYAGKTGRFKRVSNYVYGMGFSGGGGRLDSLVGNFSIDYINNMYEESRSNSIGDGVFHQFEFAYEGKQASGIPTEPKVFLSGNRVVKRSGNILINTNNQWAMMRAAVYEPLGDEYRKTPLWGISSGDALPKEYQRRSALPLNQHPITITPTDKVKEYVLSNAGSGIRFKSDGSTFNVDAIDNKYIKYAKDKSGPTFHSSSKGDGGLGDASKFVFPQYVKTKRNLDTFDKDRNGLPDSWEAKHKVADANGVKENWSIQGYSIQNKAGYTNLEIYLAELAGDFHMLARNN